MNKGNLRFEDISESSGIAAFGGWKNGITFVDINQDDYLDIYITRGGFIDDPNLNSNLLFVNQKNLQFKEEARYYKIDDPGFSIASSFFDYDNDGDLDLVVNNVDDAAVLYRNNNKEQNNSMRVKLVDYPDNKDGIGSKVQLEESDNQ
mgnify:CR=1 FL=1